ncbi:TPA: hypothetical protein JI250_18545 [Acinetobacter baumannii]|uniref:DUF6602 domain-containing protein n=2 Tax=Acinetobacter baumannii TaxID=470 RepID=A0A6B2PVH5_ACIBA|nr:hypothetical protein [Acinetobacter baumannii]MEE1853318.1 hypothetical protein [Acinetobacter baumannii]NDM76342.1 hypothetical protein [Acinetobacter baumannii]NDN73817.1 hypothetical protein [Acinetobacter baumannii]NDN81040.1 hypothetical protein [Acinetobacter baumannii]
MTVISEKFNAKVNALKSDFEVNKEIIHQGVKGGLNENALSSLIKEIVPKKYNISKGIIENSKGEQSNETDFFIYDDEILPPYLKDDFAFVPLEAVKYVFEVKSTLNSTELKTTIAKFSKFKSMGGRAPRVLFSFSSDSQGSELVRYKRNDDNFYINPSISVLCTSNKSYYFYIVEEKYLIDYLPIEDFIKNANMEESSEIEIGEVKVSLKTLQQPNVNITTNSLKINGLDYSKIKFKIHRWIGYESANNITDLLLLAGISNTLCKEKFGYYLLQNKENDMKVFSVCYEDMWGNISLHDFDENGLNDDEVSFTFSTTSESHKILFKKKNS